MKGRLTDLYYNRRPRRHIQEGTPGPALQKFNQLWLEANDYFTQLNDDLMDLPQESKDRSLATAASGIVGKYRLDPSANISDTRVRETAGLMADELLGIFDDTDVDATPEDGEGETNLSKMKYFIREFTRGLRDFHGQVEPEASLSDVPQEAEPDDSAPKPAPEKEGDGPRDRDKQFAKELPV